MVINIGKCKRARLVGKQQFAVETIDFPEVNGSPIVKVKHVGICGSDLHYWDLGDSDGKDLVLGHEYTGIVVDPGNSDFEIGDKVVGYTQNPKNDYCGTCPACLAGDYDNCRKRAVYVSIGCHPVHPGAYSEYVTWYKNAFFKIPEGVSMEQATLTEPFAVGLHAVELGGVKAGMSVLILGGGIIACAIAEWCRLHGASIIHMTEISESKRLQIKEFGIVDRVYKADDPKLADNLRASVPDGYDIVFDALALSEPLNMGLKLLRRDGTCVMVGVNFNKILVDVYETVVFQKKIQGSKGHTPECFHAVLKAIECGAIDTEKYITSRTSIDNVQSAFERTKRENSDFKVLIDFE
ncbi:MAG: zinc-binding dehydrogenase [Eubacterium sp.]